MDIKLIETEDGGDFVLKGSDLAVVNGFENMIYLALFGGNVEASTPQDRPASLQDYSYWGNFWITDVPAQFNSTTERMLRDVSLTSANRPVIQAAVISDLAFMQSFAQVSVSVTIPAINTVRLAITVTEPDNPGQGPYIFIWDGLRQDVAIVQPSPPIAGAAPSLDYQLDFLL